MAYGMEERASGTVLVLDPDLPPCSWETRDGSKKTKRTRRKLDRERFVSALEDPKVSMLAVGVDAHADLLRVMATPNVKTKRQEAIEKANRIERKRPSGEGVRMGTALTSGSVGDRINVDLSNLGGSKPSETGTLPPDGDAS